jgi:hypothetical protein
MLHKAKRLAVISIMVTFAFHLNLQYRLKMCLQKSMVAFCNLCLQKGACFGKINNGEFQTDILPALFYFSLLYAWFIKTIASYYGRIIFFGLP